MSKAAKKVAKAKVKAKATKTEPMCSNCYYWDAEETIEGEEALSGACLRNAPVPNVVGPADKGRALNVVWPHTLAEEYCGEHEPR